jgi:hypothetical protein
VLRAKRLRSKLKRSSDVKGEAIEAMACSGGEAVKGALRRWRRAPFNGGVEDLKCANGENLLSVEQAVRAPDIYIGGQMRNAHSLRRVAHFSDERRAFSEARHSFISDGKHMGT